MLVVTIARIFCTQAWALKTISIRPWPWCDFSFFDTCSAVCRSSPRAHHPNQTVVGQSRPTRGPADTQRVPRGCTVARRAHAPALTDDAATHVTFVRPSSPFHPPPSPFF